MLLDGQVIRGREIAERQSQDFGKDGPTSQTGKKE